MRVGQRRPRRCAGSAASGATTGGAGRPRSRRGRGRSAGAGRCWGVLGAVDHGPARAQPHGHLVQERDGPGVVVGAGEHVAGQGRGGEFGDPVRLGAQLTPGREQLGRLGAQPAVAQSFRVLGAVGGRRGADLLGRPHGLDHRPDLGHRHGVERVAQQLHPLLLGDGDPRRARGHQCEGHEGRVVEEDGGPGDLAAEGVPEEVHRGFESGGLREHVPGQLALRVGGLVVRGPVGLVLPPPVHGDCSVPACAERLVQQREVLLAPREAGQHQHRSPRLDPAGHGRVDDGELTARGAQPVRAGVGGRGEVGVPAHGQRLSGGRPGRGLRRGRVRRGRVSGRGLGGRGPGASAPGARGPEAGGAEAGPEAGDVAESGGCSMGLRVEDAESGARGPGGRPGR